MSNPLRQYYKKLASKNLMVLTDKRALSRITSHNMTTFLYILLLKGDPKDAFATLAEVEIKNPETAKEIKKLIDDLKSADYKLFDTRFHIKEQIDAALRHYALNSKPVLRFLFNITHGWLYSAIVYGLLLLNVLIYILTSSPDSSSRNVDLIRYLLIVDAFLFFLFVILSIAKIIIDKHLDNYVKRLKDASKKDKKLKAEIIKYVMTNYKPELKKELNKAAQTYKKLLQKSFKILASDDIKISKDFDVVKATNPQTIEDTFEDLIKSRLNAYLKELEQIEKRLRRDKSD